MSISNLMQSSSVTQYWGQFSRAASSSIAPWGKVILATSATALIGLGAYSWRRSDQDEQDAFDPDFDSIKEKVCQTYGYVFGGFAITAAAAAASHISGLSLKILMSNSYVLPIGLTVTSIVSLVSTMLISKEDTKTKHIAWTIFNVSMGMGLSPLCFLNKALIAQAAFISLGVGGLLSLSAFLAPDRKFLEWEGPLMTALTTLSIASAVAVFFPRSAFAYGVDRASLYGGLLIFSGLLMSSTQRLKEDATKQSNDQFDPINSSMSIYLDTMNLFIRILRILSENKKDENG